MQDSLASLGAGLESAKQTFSFSNPCIILLFFQSHSQNRLCEAFLLLIYGFSPYRFIKIALDEQALLIHL